MTTTRRLRRYVGSAAMVLLLIVVVSQITADERLRSDAEPAPTATPKTGLVASAGPTAPAASTSNGSVDSTGTTGTDAADGADGDGGAVESGLLQLDFATYCEERFGATATLTTVDESPFGARCALAVGETETIDTWEACRLAYGPSSRAILSESLDPIWHCTPDARRALGPADLDRYCIATYGRSAAARLEREADERLCAVIDSGFLAFRPLYPDQACQATFHGASWADESAAAAVEIVCFEPVATAWS